MKASLAIVIVNYKVRYFLKQCLSSVFESITDIDAKVYLVDNDSQDGSVQMIKSEFPLVKLIENQENLGFGKANNQVLESIDSDYLLYLKLALFSVTHCQKDWPIADKLLFFCRNTPTFLCKPLFNIGLHTKPLLIICSLHNSGTTDTTMSCLTS